MYIHYYVSDFRRRIVPLLPHELPLIMPFIETDEESSQWPASMKKQGMSSDAMDFETESLNEGRATSRGLLDLPVELLSQIASYLPLDSLVNLTDSHSTFRALAASRPLTPFAAPILSALLKGPAYPHSLRTLAWTHPYLPPFIFLHVLVRAPPRFILDDLELPRLSSDVWQEAFRRRFLPSWTRYRDDHLASKEKPSWRATFLRVLRRLDHRASGCTHDESWTRFLTLHRNGSASINRIYSRNFDPHEIFNELKLQNNFASQPTQIRLVCQLQDVRILAIGVLSSPNSLFVNRNAHDLLHPPLSRLPRPMTPPSDPSPIIPQHITLPAPSRRSPPQSPAHGLRSLPDASPPAGQDNGAPLARSITTSTTDSRNHTALPRSPTSIITSTLASFLPGASSRARRQSENPTADGASTSLGVRLMRMRSGGSSSSHEAQSRRRTMSFGHARVVAPTPASASTALPSVPSPPAIEETLPVDVVSDTGHSNVSTLHSNDLPRSSLTYTPMSHPTPVPWHRYYPNHTPGGHDLRIEHIEGDDVETSYNDGAKTEWDDTLGDRSWVGPMLLIAQLRSIEAEPMAFDGPADIVDLGSHGTYASMGFEDLDALAPWVNLVESLSMPGHSGARRDGLGFGA